MTADRRDAKLSVPTPLMDHARASVVAMVDDAVSRSVNAHGEGLSERHIERVMLDLATRAFIVGFLDWPMNHEPRNKT